MGSSFLNQSAKRSILYLAIEMTDPNPHSVNGSSKRSKYLSLPLSVPPGHVAFRLLCHASRIGGVIGKSGSVIKNLQQVTGAKIRIEDAPPESPDRVVVVIAPCALSGKVLLKTPNPAEENGDRYNGNGSGDEGVECSKAQEALLRVFERILDVAAETDGIDVRVGVVSCRLLADTAHVGSVIGKGGKVVEKIRKETGCKIRCFTDKLPACTASSDEMIEIEGNVLSVKRALLTVSRRLQDCPPVDKTRMVGSKPLEVVQREALAAVPRETSTAFPCESLPDLHVDHLMQRRSAVSNIPSSYSSGVHFPSESLPDLRVDHLMQRRSAVFNIPSSSNSYSSGVHSLSAEIDKFSALDTKLSQQEVTFKILCSNDKAGGIIGKGGSIVRALQNETGTSINVLPSTVDCDERLVIITASENPESRHSPAQKAVVLIFSRLVESGIEKGLDTGANKGSSATARLVVPSNQVGCLLGKGGAIISEMRKATRTGIRVIGSDQVPKCVSENDQVVQIMGEFSNVQDALYHATGRLRDNLFSSMQNSAGARSVSSVLTDTSPCGSLRDPAPPGKEQTVGVSHSLSRHILTQSMDHLGLSRNLDHPPSPRLWSAQTVSGISARGITDIGRGLTSFKGGLELGSGKKSAIVTNTTVEIVIPENVIGSVYGDSGTNLARLRQISGAKVIVHEPRPGTSDRTIVISGTPDETQAAQSLLQAFILTGSS
ncbi:KH domain-containing protein family [Quillaja saponaria]|uniref:KH domain-containing protein family n=1 Tax=Quillaja saponaria TaxID=32244 RepID=A0AAD7KVX1_QUISA|nr:KH domain-containing protein family [Quillaja saponaria]